MPIKNIEARFTEVGRIRLGARSDKGAPRRLESFRLTSASKEVLEAAALLYGGTVRRWTPDGAGPGAGVQWELFTEASRIPVIVPPGNIFDQWNEMWSGGGCQRRCDSETEILGGQPCLCPADPEERNELAGKGLACRPTTRLDLMLQDIPGLGVWRLETTGWYAAIELRGIVSLLSTYTAQGAPVPAHLRLEIRSVKQGGQTRHFVVPVLEMALTPRQLLEGAAVGVLPALAGPIDVPATATEGYTDAELSELERKVCDEKPIELGPQSNVTPVDDLSFTAFWPKAKALLPVGTPAREHTAQVHTRLRVNTMKEWTGVGYTLRQALHMLTELSTGRAFEDILDEFGRSETTGGV